METTAFELTPEQKNLLQSLFEETGEPVEALIAQALEGLRQHVRPGCVNGGTNDSGQRQAESKAKSPKKHIWEIADEWLVDVPEEAFDALPVDGAAE